MHIVECSFCEQAKDLVTEASLEKHCTHCHTTYENYIAHLRECERFHVHCLATTGRELIKRLRPPKEN